MNNFVTFFEPCIDLITHQLPNVLIYYAHIPSIFLSLFFIIFLTIKNRRSHSHLTEYFILMNVLFALWSSFDFIVWTLLYDSSITMAAWANLELIEILFFYVCALFAFEFFFSRDMGFKYKLLLSIPPVIIFVYTLLGQTLERYNLYLCEAVENSFVIDNLMLPFDLGFVFLIVLFYLVSIFRLRERRIQNTLFFSGLFLSLLVYLVSLYSPDYIDNYNWSLFALASMPIFLIFISFSMVRFKIFNFKVLGTNLLVFSTIFIVATQFVFIETTINRVLNIITILFLSLSGFFLIRSVKRIDTQRELLEKSNAEQEVLMHFITHQIKGFFTKSRNILDTISDEAEALSPSINRLVQEGLRSDKEGIDLVQNILNAANLKNGKITYVDNFFDMDALVKNVIKELEPSAKTKDLSINYYCTTAPIQVKADEARIKDLVRNLIQNAILYTFKGGANISLTQNDMQIEFTVKDTGIGLSDSDKTHLFQSGGRGEESVKYNTGSTGYGLFIAKKVVDNYNGQIWAESEGRDKGSKFTVVLPITH